MSSKKTYSRKLTPAQLAARRAYFAKKKGLRPMIKGRGSYYANYPTYSPYGYVPYAASTAKKEKRGYGQRLGSILGEGAEMLVNKIAGFGDYVAAPFARNIKKNSLNKLAMGQDPPTVMNSSHNNVIVRHREYLIDVVTGTAGAFNNRSWAINPGVPETFPWLSGIAQQFEQYKIRGMVFEFKSTSADALNSTNTALGTVIMATEYDATRPDFASKQAMENQQYAQSARQSCSMLHPIECARSENVLSELYVRNGGDTGQDLRFCDFGKFQLATVGQQGSAIVIGELWVSYEVELLKPRMAAPEGVGAVFSQHLRATTGISATVPFGTNPTFSGNLPISIQFTTTKFNFPDWIDQGQFLVCYQVTGTSSVVASPTISCTQGTLKQVWNNNSVTWVGDNGTDTTMSFMFILDVDGPAPVITVSGGTYPTSPTSCDLVITSFNPIAASSVDIEEVEDEEEIEEKEEKKINSEPTADNLMAKLRELGAPMDGERAKEYRLITHLLSKEFSK